MPLAGSYSEGMHTPFNRRRDQEVRSKRIRLDGEKTEIYAEEVMAAPALESPAYLNHTKVVPQAVRIERVSDGYEYVRGTDYVMTLYARGRWWNKLIPQGTQVRVKYFHEELAVDGHVLFDSAGTEIEQRRNLHFGSGFTVTDDPTNEKTLVTLGSGGSGTGLNADTLDGRDSTYFATATALAGKANTVHNHDDRYFTETEINTKLAAYYTNANAATDFNNIYLQIDSEIAQHSTSGDHDGRYYTESEVNLLLATKASTTHNHHGEYYTEIEVDNLLANKASATHNHDDRYYTETEINNKIPILRDEGSAVTQRQFINFTGQGVSVSDSGTQTVVNIPGGGGSSGGGGSARYASLLKVGAA
jgi:hypothetical protein